MKKHQFWKILSKNTNFSENLLELDTRFLTNYYKSIGFYDVKINSKFAKIRSNEKLNLLFLLMKAKDIQLIKFLQMLIVFLIKRYFSQ